MLRRGLDTGRACSVTDEVRSRGPLHGYQPSEVKCRSEILQELGCYTVNGKPRLSHVDNYFSYCKRFS